MGRSGRKECAKQGWNGEEDGSREGGGDAAHGSGEGGGKGATHLLNLSYALCGCRQHVKRKLDMPQAVLAPHTEPSCQERPPPYVDQMSIPRPCVPQPLSRTLPTGWCGHGSCSHCWHCVHPCGPSFQTVMMAILMKAPRLHAHHMSIPSPVLPYPTRLSSAPPPHPHSSPLHRLVWPWV